MTKHRIIARKRSKCECGQWVTPGMAIDYDIDRRKTMGCGKCGYTGQDVDPPDPPDMRWDGDQ